MAEKQTRADILLENMRTYPKGSQPPRSYVSWHDWAEAQHGHGLEQKQCSCGLWLFPQQAHKHREDCK